jgi:hypothetical protein
LPLNASELVLSSHTYDGEYVVEVEVEVRERQEVVVNPAAPANTATRHVHFAGMKVEYGGDYYKDGAACKKAFENALDHVPKLQKQIDIIKTLPDPPWEAKLKRTLDAVEAIQRIVASEQNRDNATKLAQYAAISLGVSPEVFTRGGAHDPNPNGQD